MADNKPGSGSKVAATDTSGASKVENWFLDLKGSTAERLNTLLEELLKFNRTVSLLPLGSLKNPESFVLADSISACRLIAPKVKGGPLYDICSGNGLPGLVFGILYPNIKVIMLEEDRRKYDIYSSLIKQLKLDNVSTQATNLERLPENTVKYVVARGFSPLQKALLVARKPVMKDGLYFHMRGDGWANELAGIPSQIFSHWTPNLLGVYRIADSPQEYAVLLMEKFAN